MCVHQARVKKTRPMDGLMTGLNELRARGRMTWNEDEQGWIGTPEEILDALVADGFQQCRRELTASRLGSAPVGGAWHGVNPQARSVASVIWVARPSAAPAVMFIELDGEAITSPGRDPDEEEGGQG